jgi:hypothetical protein
MVAFLDQAACAVLSSAFLLQHTRTAPSSSGMLLAAISDSILCMLLQAHQTSFASDAHVSEGHRAAMPCLYIIIVECLCWFESSKAYLCCLLAEIVP